MIPGIVARRTGGAWNPGAEASLKGWYDLSTPASYDNGTKTWTPRYGSGNFVASSAGPTKIATGFSAGNMGALVFTGNSNTLLQIANPGIQECVVAVVLRTTTVGTPAGIQVWRRATAAAAAAGGTVFDFGGYRAAYGSANDCDNYTLPLATDHIIVSLHSLAARTIRGDGAQIATQGTLNAGAAPTSTEGFNLGHYEGGTNWTCEVAAFGIFTTAAWTTLIVEKIEGFIAHQGLGVGASILPGGHTYKSAPP